MTFLAPLFLAGLLAVGLPLWLHRFARDTRTKQPFASLMFLEQSQIQQSREHTLKYWLLLALRILLLFLLAFAFAQPMLPWRTPPLEVRDRTLHVIVMDTSLSMQQGDHWNKAVEKATSLIGAMKSADQGLLVSADSRVRVVAGPVNGGDTAELRSALATLKPTYSRLDYGMLMTSAPSWLGNDRLKTELHLVTDLQQSATPLQFADLEPPVGVQLMLEDVGASPTTNQYVKSIGPSEKDANVYEVRVAGTAPPGAPRTVVLSIDGKEKGRKTLTPPAEPAPKSPQPNPDAGSAAGLASEAAPPAPSGSAQNAASAGGSPTSTALFADLDLGTGAHRATVRLEPSDVLPQDDEFFSVIEHREPRALIIGASASGDDVSYFAAAVGALTNPRLAVERTGSDAISQHALADYSALVVSDVGVLSGASVTAIQHYLEGGGTVLMTLGPRAARLDKIPLSGHVRSTRNLNGQGGGWTGRVASVEESHPALRDGQGWRSVRFFRYVAVEPQADDAQLIRFEDGKPLLIERHVGAGRLLVLTSPLDREWNDLAIHPLFVRFIGEAARYLTSAAAAPNALVGAILPLGVNASNGAQVFDPRGNRATALGETAERPRILADQVGFYEVRGGGRSDWIAVNADPRESELSRLSDNSISQWTRMQKNGPDAGAVTRAAAADTSGAKPALKSIWPWLLLIAVTLAFIEPLVANSHLHVRRGVTS
jgi:Aerotolerance regulator N-terminal/von Willebrand factor type A domain